MKKEVSAGGIVYKKHNSSVVWLITQHSQHKGWGFPKGLVGDVQEGESTSDSAQREVQEEGGVSARIITQLPKHVEYMYKFKGELIKKTVHYFLMEFISGNPKNHDWEMMDARFASEEDVRKTLTYKSDKDAFEMALKIFKKSQTTE